MYTLKNNGVVVATQVAPIEYIADQYAWQTDAALICDTGKAMVLEFTPPVPTSVSPRQIRQALTRANLRTQVESAVASGDQDLKDWWEFATSFERSNIHVTEMGQALGVSPTQLDDLFTLAASL